MIHPSNVLFLDIETVPNQDRWEKDEGFRKLFESRFEKEIQNKYEAEALKGPLLKSEATLEKKVDFAFDVYKLVAQQVWIENGGFYAEFNKIICVCIGVIVNTSETNHRGNLYIKSITGTEAEILTEFSRVTNKMDPGYFCGHNGIAFDFPVLHRKMWMLGLPIPKKFNNMGKKPWETNFLDTMTMWSLGEYRAKISLDRLAMALGLASPKAEFNGADVMRLYRDGGIKDIARYCQGDVKTLVNAFLRLTESDIACYEDTDLILK